MADLESMAEPAHSGNLPTIDALLKDRRTAPKAATLLLLLLFAPPAWSDCYTLDFAAPYPNPYPYGGVKLYSQPIGGGVVATFGGVWRRGWECDQPGLGNTCHPCTGQGYYSPVPNGGPPGRQREDDSGDFANAPSPGAVAWLPSGWDGHGNPDSVQITFNQDVKFVSFWYSSSLTYSFWCYAPDSCGYGQYCTVGGPLEPNPQPRKVKLLHEVGLAGSVVLDQPGTRYETGCSGDPLGSACKWTYVEFSDTTGIRRIRLEIGTLGPFFMDDLQVCTTTSTPALKTSWGQVKAIYR
jgi:hypothetical protein